MMNMNKGTNKSERGNALFLILIAVALFAALSYAITQSGRGGGTVSTEESMISAGQVTQYPAGLRTTVTRMIITGTSAQALSLSTDMAVAPCSVTPANCLFSTSGGDAVNEPAPAGVGGTPPTAWLYWDLTQATGFFIKDVGSNASPTIGEDAVAVLKGIGLTTCQQIIRGLGLSTLAAPTPDTTKATVNWTAPGANTYTATGSANTVAMTTVTNDGNAFNCVNNGGSYDYFNTLIEQ